MIDRFLNCTYGIKLYINEKHEKNSEPMKSEKSLRVSKASWWVAEIPSGQFCVGSYSYNR